VSGDQCRFCLDNRRLADEPVHHTQHFYVLLSNDPALPAATMVIPHRHSQSPFEMTRDEWADLPNALVAARAALEPFAPEGFNIGWNVGALAGQTVFHTHMHVIARRSGTDMDGKGIRHAFKSTTQEIDL
jgi:diadenosine tetraphosphate (Ap4A) HIT family hydrolase